MNNRFFNIALGLSATIILLICGGMFYSLVSGSIGAFDHFGLWGFITGTDWNPSLENENYGALPFIAGTIVTSALSLLICIPFALSIALFNGEYFRGKKIAIFLGSVTDLLAGIPSVIYGLWGFYAIRPLVVAIGLSDQGFCILTASIVLSIIIIPYAASLSSEFISMVPKDLKEGAYSLGATRFEVIKTVVFPAANSGIIASFILSLGRALGETMAVTMLIGNANIIPSSILDSGNTMASVIANQFGEASDLRLDSLIAIGLLLFLITAVINYIGRLVITRFNK